MAIKLGISACLLGQNVRYDGGHRLDHYLKDTLGGFIEWIPVCPEVECGLPVPREAMRLVEADGAVHLVTCQTGIDHTARMTRWAEQKCDALGTQDLCGFVFKSRSPSSGMTAVKVYSKNGGVPRKNGVGLFAETFMRRFSLLPVEDEGRLNDSALRENFIERVFVYSRWKTFDATDRTVNGLVAFHTDHKLLIMAHSTRGLAELGNRAANAHRKPLNALFHDYLAVLMATLRLPATVKKNVNVLQHVLGYFKKLLSPDEKQEVLEILEAYRNNFLPLIVPITLLNHYIRKFDQAYLKKQWFLHPHPVELMLRNHV